MGTAKQLRGKPVSDKIGESIASDVSLLDKNGIKPTLAIVRVGQRDDDIAYETSAMKKAESYGINVKKFTLAEDVSQQLLMATIDEINEDDGIHGALIFSPMPAHIDEQMVKDALTPEKDIDGITIGSMAGVYSGNGLGYPPCTAAACMELLEHYEIDLTGKNAVVIGRSLVIGRPVSMMLMQKNATVTICHTKTKNVHEIAKAADVLIVAAGQMQQVGKEYLNENQIILDVGIHVNEEGKLCGDVIAADAEANTAAFTPVPGGIGTITSTILMRHVVDAALKFSK